VNQSVSEVTGSSLRSEQEDGLEGLLHHVPLAADLDPRHEGVRRSAPGPTPSITRPWEM